LSDESQLPLLDPAEWISAVENTDQGEILPTPFYGGVNSIPAIVKGRTTSVGAITGMGKTAFGLQIFKTVLDGGYTGAYLTTEMTPADIFERFRHSFIDDEECKLWIKERKAIVSHPGITAEEVVHVMKAGFDLVVLDHVHDIPWDGREDLNRKVRRMSVHAPYTNTAFVMLGQTKQPDPVAPNPPSRYDFSETKVISEVSALSFILWAEDPHDDVVELHCVKNRFGPTTPPLSLRINPHTVAFERV
jgi:hypothetical protein